MNHSGPHVLIGKGAKRGVKTSQFRKTLKAYENSIWLVMLSLYLSITSPIPQVYLYLRASLKSLERKASKSDPKVAESHN